MVYFIFIYKKTLYTYTIIYINNYSIFSNFCFYDLFPIIALLIVSTIVYIIDTLERKNWEQFFSMYHIIILRFLLRQIIP